MFLSLALPLAAVGTTLLMARFLWLVWSKPAAHEPSRPGLWASWAMLLGAVAVMAWTLPLGDSAARPMLSPLKWWSGLWPLALGLALAWAALSRFRRLGSISSPNIPAGDWLAVFALLAPGAARWGRMLHDFGLSLRSKVSAIILSLPLRPSHSGLRGSRPEEWLGQWTVAGLALLSVAAVFYLLISAR